MDDEDKPDQTSVRVAVRCRPFSQKEINEGGEGCVEIASDGQTVSLTQEGQAPHSFAFDHVFGQDSTQPQVFETLGKPLLDMSFQGYNSTIFAYGQTGSGKTHTMMSDRKSDDRGLIPRISESLFERVNSLTTDSRKFLICCSFLEIYNEIVYDLLVPRGKSTPKTGLEIREQKGIGVYVKDLQEIVVDSSEKLQKLIDQGFEHRATSATNMNATSSRSHCLFIVKMHQKDEENASNNNFSKMNLVDLAGSERASRTGAQGDTLKEGANINKSLSSLGNVINALSKMASGSKKVFIPYRDSKLTRVLQESLGGNALTTMMAAMSPAKTNYEETLSTLNYAKRAKTIKVNATKNEESEQIARLQEEVEALRSKLAQQASGVVDTTKYEAQIEEMERFMKQTWDDKEAATRQHEEERKALAAEAEKIKQKALEEKNKRIQLLEAKGDLELSVQDLRIQADGGSAWTACSDTWPKAIAHVMGLEQRIGSQSRTVGLLKDSVLQDMAAWVEQRMSQGRDADEGSAASRLLLQQAERKANSVLKELDKLEKQERELECAVAELMPEVRRMHKGVDLECSQTKEDDKDKDEEKDSGKSEAAEKVLSLINRQLESHRASSWAKIAEDHRLLGSFGTDGVKGLLGFCSGKGRDVEELELKLEVGSSSGSQQPPSPRGRGPRPGAEAVAVLCRPLGLASGEMPDSALSASSNKEAAYAARLFDGVPLCAFGGWCPAKNDASEYLEIDLQAPFWVCGLSVQGRRPASGDWQRTRPLVGKVIEPDPVPPERVFRRPPVRLVHDVVAAVATRHKALVGQEGLADFSPEQLDYKTLQKADRQFKVDFFELLVAKVNAGILAAGMTEDVVAPLEITPTEILGGKNTGESNRMLQLLCYLGLRQQDPKGELGGLLDCGEQWVSSYTVSWSSDGTSWTPVSTAQGGEPLALPGAKDAERARYASFGLGMPTAPVRYLRVHPKEWQRHPGLRLEVHGWPEGVDLSSLAPPTGKAKSGKMGRTKSSGSGGGADAAGVSPGVVLADRSSRLEVVRAKTETIKQLVELAGSIVVDAWKESQKADAERNQQAMAEKTAVEQQLADALQQLEALRAVHASLEEKAADTEQRLTDADTEKLRLEVDKDRMEQQLKSTEEKLELANQTCHEEKSKVEELQRKEEENKIEKEELLQQVSVLAEECDAHKQEAEDLNEQLATKEEELMNTNEGYCHLTEQLNEAREENDEEIMKRDSVIDTLTQRNQELLNEGISLRQDLGDWKRRLTDAEKAVQRAQQGLPINYRFTIIKDTISPGTSPNGKTPQQESVGKEEKKSRKKSKGKYDEDFDDED